MTVLWQKSKHRPSFKGVGGRGEKQSLVAAKNRKDNKALFPLTIRNEFLEFRQHWISLKATKEEMGQENHLVLRGHREGKVRGKHGEVMRYSPRRPKKRW